MDLFFRVDETVAWIRHHGFKRVALQLPDALLHLSFTLSRLFEPFTAEFCTFVCADSNYGDCCIDQITALHNAADCVVHYGLSCLSRPTRLAAFLVFCDVHAQQSFDQFDKDRLQQVLYEPLSAYSRVYVEFDVRYDALTRAWFTSQQRFTCCAEPPRELLPASSSEEQVDAKVPVDYSQYDAVVFVGPSECAQLDRIAMQACSTGETQVFSFDLSCAAATSPPLLNIQANRALARRFVLMERVKDAQIFGILVGTMSVAGYSDVIAHIKHTIEQEEQGRKSYLFVFGKLSTAKLANFAHVDAFVLVACPLHSLVSKSFEFNKPIVTPYELQVALADRPWGKYLWDFARILEPFDDAEEDGEDEEEDVRFSLATGSITSKAKKTTEAAVVPGAKNTLSLRYESPAAQALQRAAFQGLDPADSRDKPPARAVPGQIGVASRVFNMTDAHKQSPH